jgi:hypothetical protein
MSDKPLGIKAYGSIPHLPGSRLGPGEHTVPEGQFLICCKRPRDKHDVIIVQEKLDGSCTAVAKLNGEIIPLIRAGYRAITSPFQQHVLFHNWVMSHFEAFYALLDEGERVVGEWLAQAHGTRYRLPHGPWVAFDIMVGHERFAHEAMLSRMKERGVSFVTPFVVHRGPISIEKAMRLVKVSHHGAIDPVEGLVWRVERKGKVDFLAKYVRPDKIDGLYLPEKSGKEAIWNWP